MARRKAFFEKMDLVQGFAPRAVILSSSQDLRLCIHILQCQYFGRNASIL